MYLETTFAILEMNIVFFGAVQRFNEYCFKIMLTMKTMLHQRTIYGYFIKFICVVRTIGVFLQEIILYLLAVCNTPKRRLYT